MISDGINLKSDGKNRKSDGIFSKHDGIHHPSQKQSLFIRSFKPQSTHHRFYLTEETWKWRANSQESGYQEKVFPRKRPWTNGGGGIGSEWPLGDRHQRARVYL
ncbi:hypothetical protein D9X91_13180 [Falsibacillus albus]|uniref:Uncharacterized protein n=1 Tax=Falsibacillus albus TaxID=2478915 RepID=A0A3L7K1F1_9BACI|nr:hypothetical protein D9X91_13180 [Falsibacillus albus]